MKITTLKGVGVFSVSLFAAFSAAYIYSPTNGTHADNSTTADVNLSVNEVMSLTLNTDTLNLSATPNSFISGIITATVSTNSQYGYTLTLEDEDSDSNMVHTNSDISSVVTSSFSGSKTSTDLEDNTWGFSLNATDFYKVPVNGSPVALKRSTTPMETENESSDITFGAKVGNITSGTYTDKVLFTLYVNGQDGKPTNPDDPTNPPADPSEPGGNDDLDPNDPGDGTSFQSFDGCDLIGQSDPATTLVDSRDNSTYRIKKLKDGNCWMVDSLKLTNFANLTYKNSDLPKGATWTIPESNPEIGLDDFETMNNNEVYFDPIYNQTVYSFYTATAGWGTSVIASGESDRSICPKGWRLPTNAEFQALFNSYSSDRQVAGAGYFYGAPSIYNGNPSGFSGFWSSTAADSARAYLMYGMSGSAMVNIKEQKYGGNHVRCIAKNN